MVAAMRKSVWPLVAILGLVYLAYDVGSQQYLVSDGGVALVQGALRVHYIPNPNDIVNLAEGTPYTVPDGRVLIITDYTVTDVVAAWSYDEMVLRPRVRVNGLDVWGSGYFTGNGQATSASLLSGSLRSGVLVDGGSTVTLHSNPADNEPGHEPDWDLLGGNPQMFASGYLANAQ